MSEPLRVSDLFDPGKPDPVLEAEVAAHHAAYPEPVTGTTAERNDLPELAAFLNEFRVTWRPLGWPERDRMRGMALEALYRFRAQQEATPPRPPGDCPWDVSGLVGASREMLLSALRNARFNEAQLRSGLAAAKAGAGRERADDKAALARVRSLLSWTRKTVPMDALRAAVYGQPHPEHAAVEDAGA